MRNVIIIVLLFIVIETNAQSINCQDLYNTVISDYDYSDKTTCFGSSMLAKAEYYEYNSIGFVVAYIKEGDYDFSGKPYIFCGISSYTWTSFKSTGMFDSWGESFHEYIMDNKCNCY